MKLNDWRAQQGMTRATLAARLGVAENTVFRWDAAIRTPTAAMQRRISALTGGAVAPEDWDGERACGGDIPRVRGQW